ncbi:MAG: hypothetical protein RIM68_01085, partial [Arenibacter sp.]
AMPKKSVDNLNAPAGSSVSPARQRGRLVSTTQRSTNVIIFIKLVANRLAVLSGYRNLLGES